MNKGLLAALVILLACAGAARAGDEPTSCDNGWVDGGYLLWWVQGMRTPPLVTTGPLGLTAQQQSGILGQPGTEVLVGDNRIEEPLLHGGRISAGWWFDCDHTLAIEGGFFGLFQRSRTTTFTSDSLGDPVLARPIIDARSGQESELFVSAPGAFSSTAGVSVVTKTSLLGAEANLLWVTEHYSQPYWNLLAGFRYLDLRESLGITQNTEVLPGGVAFYNTVPLGALNNVGVQDNFTTRNDFIGGQLGVRWGLSWERVVVNVTGKLAIGATREEVDIGGLTVLTPASGKVQATTAGLLTLSSNSGGPTRWQFAVVPGVDATVGFDVTPRIRLLAGYSFLLLSDVVRPGGAIDRAVNRTLLPTSQVFDPAAATPSRPGFVFNGESFWAQGVTAGVSVSF
jgi:hypothetical protein